MSDTSPISYLVLTRTETAQTLFESEFPILPPGSRKKPSVQAAGNDLGVKKSEET
ncbi:hypothetical protein [Salinibacter ruber]|uniref:hypothetical protein n=1 Tax=Salinibacter ruber TaxID=146919 RepID=UPI0021689B38|nr:hypothetical protein [Salinibacter ruber]MCS4223564.1 hypothetical protein [Salinibacter ruber]